jgi:hypothetical protein
MRNQMVDATINRPVRIAEHVLHLAEAGKTEALGEE